MPGRDGTGPMGKEPKSSRSFGPCAGYQTIPYGGCGMGRSRGNRWISQTTGAPGWIKYGYPATEQADPIQGKAFLENLARYQQGQLEQVKNQLKKLEE